MGHEMERDRSERESYPSKRDTNGDSSRRMSAGLMGVVQSSEVRLTRELEGIALRKGRR